MNDVIGISCVKNEADIIEAFVRHNLTHVDALIVMNHASRDETRAILEKLVAEGLPLTVVDDFTVGYHQVRRLRTLFDLAIERGARFVVPLDADELAWGPGRLADVLRAEEAFVGAWPWVTHVVDPDDDPSETNPARRMTQRLAVESHPWTKVVVSAELGRVPGSGLTQGSHAFETGAAPIAPRALDGFSVAHFPIRSFAQHVNKVMHGYLQSLTMPEWDRQANFHYIAPFELLVGDPAAFRQATLEQSRYFAVSDRSSFTPRMVRSTFEYRGDALRYTPTDIDADRALRLALGFAEELALACREKAVLASEAALRIESLTKELEAAQESVRALEASKPSPTRGLVARVKEWMRDRSSGQG